MPHSTTNETNKPNETNKTQNTNEIPNKKETLGFQTEVNQLLKLVIHSLYSNSEIFLRELVSNASDAADKLRFAALSDPQLLERDHELRVTIDFDKEAQTITISDNGIGMSRPEVIDHLGTIAKSGTRLTSSPVPWENLSVNLASDFIPLLL